MTPPASWLELSDERDMWLARVLNAQRDAYQRGHEDGEAAGYARAIADLKRAQHYHVRELRQHLTTWDGLRTRFGRPREADYVPSQDGAA